MSNNKKITLEHVHYGILQYRIKNIRLTQNKRSVYNALNTSSIIIKITPLKSNSWGYIL